MTLVYGDFETRSCVDLKVSGLDRYACSPQTEVLCFGFAIDDGASKLAGKKNVHEFLRPLKEGAFFVAHNAPFELAIWNNICVPRFGWPPLRPEQVYCTMAEALAMGLPGSLDNAASAMGLDLKKDAKGHRVMLQLSKPKYHSDTVTSWVETPDKVKALHEYCLQDVEVERALFKRLVRLSPRERDVWLLDQKINNRGAGVNMRALTTALRVVGLEKERLDKKIDSLTNGAVATCTSVAQIKDWVKLHFELELASLDKTSVEALLANQDLSPELRAVLLLRQEGSKSSTAKVNAIINAADLKTNRVRYTMQYHGAQTGRWAGRRINPQNFPRPSLPQKVIDDIIRLLEEQPAEEVVSSLGLLYDSPTSAISDCIRGFIKPAPGKDFIGADFSSIEARVLAWLAGQENVLEIFRDHGQIYEHAASAIYGVAIEDVTKSQRQIGKVAVLALGYQGGKIAFQKMAKQYGVEIEESQANHIKNAWRNKNPYIVKYWHDLDLATRTAVLNPGTTAKAGSRGREVHFKVSGSFLWAKLPSGRVLCYPYPKFKDTHTPWGESKDALTCMTVDSVTKKWGRRTLYGGLLCENVTQAVARDLLAEALFRLEAAGYPVVLHVHDEVLCEVDLGWGSVAEVERIMSEVPAWASGLPIAAEGFRGDKYRK